MKAKTAIAAVMGCLVTTAANAAPPIDKDYIRSLAAPGKTVLVIEYWDGSDKLADRKGYASASGFKAVSGTDFRVDDKVTLHLFGVEACKGDMVNKRDGFAGSCADYAQQQLQIQLKSSKVLFCRSFVTEVNAPSQDTTCWGYHYYASALNSVDMLEEQMVSLGALRLTKKPDGSLARPDLAKAEEIGVKGNFGMWADPRVKAQ